MSNVKYIANLVPRPADNRSVIEKLAELPEEARKEIVDDYVKKYCGGDPEKFKYMWSLWARPDQIVPDGDFWRIYCFCAGRGWGKLLPLNTLVPTINGWKLMKDINIGDILFDEKGDPCNVTFVSDIEENPELYDITFSDETIVTACKDHQWTVWRKSTFLSYHNLNERRGVKDFIPEDWATWEPNKINDKYLSLSEKRLIRELALVGTPIRAASRILGRKRETIRKYYKSNIIEELDVNTYTTEQLENFINSGEKIIIPNTQAVKYEKKNLPIHPWAFGYILGDGCTLTGSQIACDPQDKAELIQRFRDCGIQVSEYPNRPGHFGLLDIAVIWKSLKLNECKFIPDDYLQSSIEDRLELVRGLIDSDGYVDKTGYYSFSNTNIKIVEGLKELVESLGFLCRVKKITPRFDKRLLKPAKESYRFYIRADTPLSTLKRKYGRAVHALARCQKSRQIMSIKRAETIPGKCITVDSPSSLFLITKSFVPNHNTKVGSQWAIKKAYENPGCRIAVVGATASDTNKVIVDGESGILNSAPPDFRPNWQPTYKRLIFPNKSLCELYALDVNTDIPTPSGFKKVLDLKIGDQVFSDNGVPCNIVEVTPIFLDADCYELTFKNGQKVIADCNHLWKVCTAIDKTVNKRNGFHSNFKIRTSEDIYNNFSRVRIGRENDLDNWIIRTKPVEYLEKNLLIPAYTLGAWLGDGNKNDGTICSMDPDIIEVIRREGYFVKQHSNKFYWQIYGLKPQLRELGVLKNKHIPEIYKQGSTKQRIDLLAGLLDTDAFVGKENSEVVFGNTNENLVDGVCEIVSSLGGWTTKLPQNPKINFSYNQKPSWKVSIRGINYLEIFKLPRKLERLRNRRISEYLPITDIKKIDSVPVKCIKVDSENSLFLITRGYIPTHNSAQEPDRLRGPQHHFALLDELTSWTYVQSTFDMLSFGLRLGENPQMVITTTPRPIDTFKKILSHKKTFTVIGTTYDNRSNLAASFFEDIISKYEGTRLGLQELEAQIIEDVPGALWTAANLEKNRINLDQIDKLPDFLIMVVGVDPAVTAVKGSAETGICVAAYGADDHFYVLYLDSFKDSPAQWANRVLDLYDQFKADKIVVEINNGGDLVEHTIRQYRPYANITTVHATKGKVTRAEPVAALYSRNRVHHVGVFSKGESQMTSFHPIENPSGLKDCVDSTCWSLFALMEQVTPTGSQAPSVGGIRSKLVGYRYR